MPYVLQSHLTSFKSRPNSPKSLNLVTLDDKHDIYFCQQMVIRLASRPLYKGGIFSTQPMLIGVMFAQKA